MSINVLYYKTGFPIDDSRPKAFSRVWIETQREGCLKGEQSMDSPQKANVRRLKRMLGEVVPYLAHRQEPTHSWKWIPERDRETKAPIVVQPGFEWDRNHWPVWFSIERSLPNRSPDERIWLRSWFGGESCVYVDGHAFGEINVHHRELDLSPFCDGRHHRIDVEVVPYGLFGTPEPEIRFTEASILWKKTDVVRAFKTFQIAIELFENTTNEELMDRLMDDLERAFRDLSIPRGTNEYFQTALQNPSLAPEVTRVWNPPDFPKDIIPEGGEEARISLVGAARTLQAGLDRLAQRFPSQGSLWAVGHAHIDYAWLWPVEETQRKIVRTFANALQLTEKYPQFVFSQSSAQMYEDLARMDPKLFGSIQEKAAQGQWEAVGGMWVESDCNIPAAESLIRQLEYGQAFFLQHFGKRSRVCWLPDVFGFPWILPQILQQAGIELFVTTKINWNDTNRFPHDLCLWRGIDGTQVIYHSFDNPSHGYNGVVDIYGLTQTWENYRQKALFPSSLYSFGYGDGGGGPTDDMVESFLQMNQTPQVPKLAFQRMEDYLQALQDEPNLRETLPEWDGELYLELHRGTLTSQSRTKRLHKHAESWLCLWELFAAHDQNHPYPHDQIDACWKELLKNEFHDILPGSSIKEVYDRANQELSAIIEQAKDGAKNLWLVAREEDQTSIINPSSWSQNALFFWEGEPRELTDDQGNPILQQPLDNGMTIYCAEPPLEPFQSRTFSVSNQPVRIPDQAPIPDQFILANETLSVQVMEDGSAQVEHLPTGRKAFAPTGNQLYIYPDVPSYWDAWDVDLAHEAYATRLKAERIEWIHTGPIRWTIRVTYGWEQTQIIQDYHLDRGSERLDIETHIDWRHRRTLLKALFPTTILSRKARYDLSAGYIERPTHRNTSWEEAQFTVPAHRWVDLSQRDFGVSILNDGLYGHQAYQSTIGLMLIKSGVFPDFYADEGHHHFSYAIYPHHGQDLLPVIQQAHALNSPFVLNEGCPAFPLGIQTISDPNLKVLAIKKSGDGATILRLAEMTGGSGQASIVFSQGWSKVSKTTILEDEIEILKQQNRACAIDYRPFEILTLKLWQ